MNDPVVVTSTGGPYEGRVVERSHLPIGVRPDRFGVIRFKGTGDYVSVDGVLAEVVTPDD